MEPSGAPAASLDGNGGPIYALAVIPDAGGRSLLASAGADTTVRLWEPVTGQTAGRPIASRTGRVWVLAAVPTADSPTLLASAGNDSRVTLWDPITGMHVHTLVGHTGPESVPGGSTASALQATLERHPAIRLRLRERLLQQPDRSARDAKRLLTLWQFYARVLDRVDHLDSEDDEIRRGRQLIVVAEIVTRWPALQTAFCRPCAPRVVQDPDADGAGAEEASRGLQVLAAAAHDDLAWDAAIRAVLREAAGDVRDPLRALLGDYDGAEVAALHARLT